MIPIGLARANASRDASHDASQFRARVLARDLDVMRHRRSVRVLNRLFDRGDLQNTLSPAYQQLKDDSLIFLPTLRGYCLQMSVNLQRVGGLGYPLVLPRSGLSGLLLAPVADIRPA